MNNQVSSLDKNFRTGELGASGIDFFNVQEFPFCVEGFAWRVPGGPFFRLPDTFTDKEINAEALSLSACTAGGVVRFRSNSRWIVVRAVFRNSLDLGRMPRSGSGGCDLYGANGCIGHFQYVAEHGLVWLPTAAAAPANELRFMGMVEPAAGFPPVEQKLSGSPYGKIIDFQLNMPLYGGIESLEIGVMPGAALEPPTPRRITLPLLFYGESITQGGCASRAGNSHVSMLGRSLDAEVINMGFSGSGKAESALAEAIAKLPLAGMICDLGHAPNAPNFLRIIREAQPDLPILIVSKSYSDEKLSRTLFEASDNRHTWFLHGRSIFADNDACTVDGAHPNDLGFHLMYRAMLPILRQMLTAEKQ